MNIKNLGLLFIFFSFCFSANGQSGLQFYGGISNATNKDALITPTDRSHAGYHFGADARLIDGKMYFVLGGQYHKIEFLAQEEKSYFSVDNSMNWLKFRVGLGYQLFKVTDKVFVRAKTLLSFNIISSIPDDVTAPYTNYNDGTVGAVLCIGADFFNFTLDAEFENGFFKAVNMVDGTEFNFFTLSLGYKI